MDASSPELSGSVPGNDSTAKLTIVFVTDGSEMASTRIRENVRWICDTNILVERIQIAGPQSSGISVADIARHLIPVCTPDLQSCLSRIAGNSERVAFVGATTILDESVRPILAQKIRSDEALSWFQPASNSGTIWARLVSIITRTIQRLILGTGKHEMNCGGLLLRRESLDKLRAEGITCTTIDQLIAGCRVIDTRNTETRIGSTASNGPRVTVRSAIREFATACRFWWQQIAFPSAVVSSVVRQTENHSQPWSPRQNLIATAILLVAAIGVLFTGLAYPLFEPDETRNAQLALNIVDSGDWLSLQLNGDYYWNKPPLLAWMTAISYTIFGPGEYSTRLPCALCSFLTLAIVLILGSRLFGFRTGLFGAAMLLICTGFVTISRYVTMDASITLFTTTMCLATLMGIRGDKVHPRWLLLAGIACGLGMLTKGPVILVLVLPPVLLFGWLRGESFWRRRSFWLWPGVPAFLTAGPWFLAMGIVHPDFLAHFFWKHNLVRFSDAFDHREPFWFYAPILVLMMYPACFLLPALGKRLIFSSRTERQQLGTMFPAVLLAGLWPIGFFSMADSKLPTYILPALPMLCLLLGRVIDMNLFRTIESDRQPDLQRVPGFLATSAAIMTVAVVVAAVFVFRSVPTGMAVPLAFTLAATLIFLWLARSQTVRPLLSWTSAICVAIVFAGTGTNFLIPVLSEHKSVHGDVARKTQENGFENVPILYYGVAPDGSSFSLAENANPTSFADEDYGLAAKFLLNHPKTILVTTKDTAKSLAKNLAGAVELTPDPRHKKLFSVRTIHPVERQAQAREFRKIR